VKSLSFEELRPCDICKSPVTGNTRDVRTIDFHRIVIERHMLNPRAVQERAALEVMFGGNAALASVFSSRPKATHPIAGRELLICNPCWMDTARLGRMPEYVEGGEGYSKGREIPAPEVRP